MTIVGLTGGIGSGKSTIAEMFKEKGIPVYDSDIQAKSIMGSAAPVISDIKALLGNGAYDKGQLQRRFVADKVFKDPALLEKLNAIVHPAVREHFKTWVLAQESPYVIQETALLFEQGMEARYDAVILVTAPLEIRIARVMQRDGVSRKSVTDRIANQWPEVRKIPLADYVIHNLELEKTRSEINTLHSLILDFC